MGELLYVPYSNVFKILAESPPPKHEQMLEFFRQWASELGSDEW